MSIFFEILISLMEVLEVYLDWKIFTISPVYESMTLTSLSRLQIDIMNLEQEENITVQIQLFATLNFLIKDILPSIKFHTIMLPLS